MKQPFFIISSLFLFLLHSSTTLAQLPALAPAPPGPTNVTKILEKAGQFTLFIRLLKATHVAEQLFGQLNNTDNGITIFAPTDNAFSSLSAGTLNSLNDEEKDELVQFHIVSSYLTAYQFQTVSNPLRTQAGDNRNGKFPLNVTMSGNAVNITSGLTNTSISGTVYTDGQLAVYQVDQVLLPQKLFVPQPPAPAPAPVESKKKKKSSDDSPVADSPVDAAGAAGLRIGYTVLMVVVFAAALFSL